MKLKLFCVAEDIKIDLDNNPIIHNLIDTIATSQFPVIVRYVMCCIVTGTVVEHPHWLDFKFGIEDDQGEYQSGYSMSVRSNHHNGSNNAERLHSVHVLPAGRFVFKVPGAYTARMTLEDGNSLRQIILLTDSK